MRPTACVLRARPVSRLLLSAVALALGVGSASAQAVAAQVVPTTTTVLAPARPSDTTPHPDADQSAAAWADVFSALVAAHQWSAADLIAPIGPRSFAAAPIWTAPKFQAVWSAWQLSRSQRAWVVGDDGRSLWRLAEGTDVLRPSLGVVHQPDGAWWLVLAEPPGPADRPTPTWPCAAQGCAVRLLIAQPGQSPRPVLVTAHDPDGHQDGAPTRILGFPLWPSLVASGPARWTITPPNGAAFTFDVGFLHQVCAGARLPCDQPASSPAPAGP